jgi:hypothetical protein
MSKRGTEDSEDHEIFDIIDFTTASDWERFEFKENYSQKC